MKQNLRDWSAFAGLQLALCLAVFGSALWGARLLAPDRPQVFEPPGGLV